MKILIIDDHVLFREGLISLLTNHRDILAVGEAGSAEEALEKISELKPDVVLVDIHPQNGGMVETIKTIKSKKPDIKIVVFTVDPSGDELIEAIQSGAVGYLYKKIPVSQLLLSLHAIMRGEIALSREMMSRLVVELQQRELINNNNNSEIITLSPRENEVLQLLSEKLTNKEISERLFISENTVKVHVHNILDKLNCRNRYEAGRFARRSR